jgi:hypothetical protein
MQSILSKAGRGDQVTISEIRNLVRQVVIDVPRTTPVILKYNNTE